MRRVVFLLPFFWLYSVCCSAAVLYAVIVCDTNDITIGFSVEADYYAMRGEVQQIAYHTGLTLNEKIFQGEDVYPENIINFVDNLQLQEDDIVFFYFSGHGYRTPSKQNQWPFLYFSLEHNGTDLSLISEKLKNKHPHLVVTMADCCNNVIPDKYAPPIYEKRFVMLGKNTRLEKNYKKLFIQQTGQITVSSSQQGQYSWGGSQGGLFTSAFLKTLSEEVLNKSPPKWNAILSRTSGILAIQTAKLSKQQPEYLIDIH